MHPRKILNWKSGLTLQGCLNPSKITFRLIAHILISFLTFGIFFCLDTPGALQDYFQNDLHMSSEKFVMLYTIFSWPNIIVSFFGGFLLDRVLGIRRGTVIYTGIAIIGQLIFTAGAYINAFWLMMVGRLIFGIASELVNTAQNSIAALYFKSKELHFNFGLQMTLGGMGSTVNFLIMEDIYSYVSKTLGYKGSQCIGIVLFFAALTCVASILCALFLGIIDNRSEKDLKQSERQEPEIMRLKDIKNFKTIFWLAALISITYYVCLIPFICTAKVYFITVYGFKPAIANTASSLIYSIPAVTSPVFGILMDKIGKNIFWIIASVSGALLTHGLLAFTRVSPYVCMAILGLSFSLFSSSVWPFFALTVSKHQLGTAYGMIGSLLNLGVAVSSIISGIIIDHYGYIVHEFFFFASLFISLGAAMALWILESKIKRGYSVNGQMDNKTSHLSQISERSNVEILSFSKDISL